MKQQASFSELEYAAKKRVTRRDRFLSEIESVTPWAALVASIAPYYPKGDGRGRPPIGLERMLRMYIAQQCIGLSDEGIEDALYDGQAIRRFVGIDLSHEAAPDATTLLKFRRLLETHQLTRTVFDTINRHLTEKGLMLKEGTVVDATIIAAPSSTKNQNRARDPEMHQTKKGNNWHFGMTSRRRRTPDGRSREAGCGHERSEAAQVAHIGVDAESGLTHTVVTTPANVHDVTQVNALLHGEERHVHGDAGYVGAEKRDENQNTAVTWHIAMRPGTRRALPDTPLGLLLEKIEYAKAQIWAKVEHPFHVIKNLFKHRKVRYQGLAKNAAQLFTLFGLANLVLARKRLGALHAQVAP